MTPPHALCKICDRLKYFIENFAQKLFDYNWCTALHNTKKSDNTKFQLEEITEQIKLKLNPNILPFA